MVSVAAWLRDRESLAQIGGRAYLAQLTDATPAVAHVGATRGGPRKMAPEAAHRHLPAGLGRGLRRRRRGAGVHRFGGAVRLRHRAHARVLERPAPRAGAARRLRADHAAAERGDRITGISTGYERLDGKTAGLHDGRSHDRRRPPGHGKDVASSQPRVNVASPRTVTVAGPGRGATAASATSRASGCACSPSKCRASSWRRAWCAPRAASTSASCAKVSSRPTTGASLTEAASYLSTCPSGSTTRSAIGMLELRAKVRRIQAEYNREANGTSRAARGPRGGRLPAAHEGPRRRQQPRAGDQRDLPWLEAAREGAAGARDRALAAEPRGRDAHDEGQAPQLSDLRESGAIEQDADTIIFIYRDEYYNPETTNQKGIAELIIAKQRNGPTGKVKVRFASSCTRFDNLAPGDYPDMADDE
jgi:replicative DNA helicase